MFCIHATIVLCWDTDTGKTGRGEATMRNDKTPEVGR